MGKKSRRVSVPLPTGQIQAQSMQSKVVHAVSVSSYFLPPPDIMAMYKETDPRLVDVIIQRAKAAQDDASAEQKNRHRQADKVVILSWGGLLFAFISVMCMLGLTCYAIYKGQQISASVLGGTGIVMVISAYRKFAQR